jgi:hypothetical protein
MVNFSLLEPGMPIIEQLYCDLSDLSRFVILLPGLT